MDTRLAAHRPEASAQHAANLYCIPAKPLRSENAVFFNVIGLLYMSIVFIH